MVDVLMKLGRCIVNPDIYLYYMGHQFFLEEIHRSAKAVLSVVFWLVLSKLGSSLSIRILCYMLLLTSNSQQKKKKKKEHF